MYSSALRLVRVAATVPMLLSSGPMTPVVPASATVWQMPHVVTNAAGTPSGAAVAPSPTMGTIIPTGGSGSGAETIVGPGLKQAVNNRTAPTARANRVTMVRDGMPGFQSKCSILALCYDFHTRVSR